MPPSGKRGRIVVSSSSDDVDEDGESMTDRRGGEEAVFTEGSHVTESIPLERGLFSSSSEISSSSSSSSTSSPSSAVMRNIIDSTLLLFLLLLLWHDKLSIDSSGRSIPL